MLLQMQIPSEVTSQDNEPGPGWLSRQKHLPESEIRLYEKPFFRRETLSPFLDQTGEIDRPISSAQHVFSVLYTNTDTTEFSAEKNSRICLSSGIFLPE